MPQKTEYKCPHCGWMYDPADPELQNQSPVVALVPEHNYPPTESAVCPGSNQIPRNALSDRRPLWKDDKNEEA